MEAGAWAVFLNGSYGVGKSAVADHVGDLLAEAGQGFAVMDVDWFHRAWPPAPGDVDNVVVEAEIVAAVWQLYSRSGPRLLVVAGVIATAADRSRYEDALGVSLRSVRLEASGAVRAARLRARYGDQRPAALAWHLARHQHLAEQLAAANLDQAVIDTDDLPPLQVAEQVLAHIDH